jgi:hypothetical protein
MMIKGKLMGFFTPRRSFAILLLAFIATNASSQSVDRVSKIEQRAMDVVEKVTGSKGNFRGIVRAPELPGLSNATIISFADGAVTKSFVMLPDGETLILGNIFDLKLLDQAVANESPDIAKNATTESSLASNNAPYAEPKIEAKKVSNDTRPKVGNYDPNVSPMAAALYDARSEYDHSDDRLTIHDLRADAFSTLFPDIESENAVEAYMGLLRETNQIKENDGKNKDRMYIFYDPLCGFCVKEHKSLREHIDKGDFAVSFVPVATASPAPYTYVLRLLDKSLSNEQRLDRLKWLLTERPIEDDIKIRNKGDSERRLQFNNVAMGLLRSGSDWLGSGGTPQIVIEKQNGDLFHFRGYQKDKAKMLSYLAN